MFSVFAFEDASQCLPTVYIDSTFDFVMDILKNVELYCCINPLKQKLYNLCSFYVVEYTCHIENNSVYNAKFLYFFNGM